MQKPKRINKATIKKKNQLEEWSSHVKALLIYLLKIQQYIHKVQLPIRSLHVHSNTAQSKSILASSHDNE